MSLDQQAAEQAASSRPLPYQLSTDRAPGCGCGTGGSRNCICVILVEARTPGKRLAREADAPAKDLVDMNRVDHPQHEIHSIQAKNEDVTLVHSIVITKRTKEFVTRSAGC